MTGWNNFDNQ